MTDGSIPDDVRRFVLTNVLSVPHLEAMLLLRGEASEPWDAARAARRLYVSVGTAEQLLTDLHAAGIVEIVDPERRRYCYAPSSDDLRRIIDRVAVTYARNIVQVTTLIHSNTSKKVQQFADAFKLRKD